MEVGVLQEVERVMGSRGVTGSRKGYGKLAEF